MESKLAEKKCVPCEGGELPLGEDEIQKYLQEIGTSWQIVDEGKKIEREWKFKDFNEAIAFVNKVAGVAEHEGHHPDIHVHYCKVRLVLWTHAISGLHKNDFILAAKINNLQ